jgi:predicted nuclease of restriction endonuclease-like (RecB) superfamily
MKNKNLPENYPKILDKLKSKIHQVRYKSFRAVNKELIKLYFEIGKTIVKQQEEQGWGKSVVENLARDLQVEFPGIQGFSVQNLWYMKKFYEIYMSNQNLQPLAGEVPWTHNQIILDKCKTDSERKFYLKQVKEFSLSKRILLKMVKGKEFERYLANQTNFKKNLPEKQSDIAIMSVKDDYNLDFLALTDEHTERQLEAGLVENIVKFLAEMGGYFAFVGRQFKVKDNDEEFFIDLLFYHRKLKCLVAVELKAGRFEPEHAGKMQFYLNVLDNTERMRNEKSSIGIIICKEKNRTRVEYTLKDVKRPIGVASYNQYSNLSDLPSKIAKYLPSEEEIKKRLAG